MNPKKQKQKLAVFISALALTIVVSALHGLASYSDASLGTNLLAADTKVQKRLNVRQTTKKRIDPKAAFTLEPKPKPKKSLTRRNITKKLKNGARDAGADLVVKNAPKLIKYAGKMLPKNLVLPYRDTDVKQTVLDTASGLRSIIIEGDISNTKVEGVVRDLFGSAVADTGVFATEMMTKYNLQNVAKTILKDPKNAKAIGAAVQAEVENYAKAELNKLANQALGTFFPVLQGVQFDFTNLNSKTLKSTIRSAIVNALAQSYLGPQYVAVYLAVSTVCPPCMQKAHAELRRFDKNYIRPLTDSVDAEWGRFEDRVKAESARVGKQISAELNRLKDRVGAEFTRQREDVQAELNRAKTKFNAELERAKQSKVGIEITRELTGIQNEAVREFNQAKAELEREYRDVAAEAKRVSKRVGAEIQREINDQLTAMKKLGNSARNELTREAKQVSEKAKEVKNKIQAELKRIADQAQAALNKAGCQGQKVINKLRGKKKKKKC